MEEKKKKRGRKPKEKLAELEEKAKQCDEYLDRLLRTKAEFDNYRKRVEKEKGQLLEYAIEDFVLELLRVVDNIERALKVEEEAKDLQSFVDGVKLVYKEFQTVLSREGLERIESVGKKFKPEEHDAVMYEESEETPEGVIIEELQTGYKLRGKVIRPTMVKVSKGKQEQE